MSRELALIGTAFGGLALYLLAELVAEAVFGTIAYWTAKLALPVLTFGKIWTSGLAGLSDPRAPRFTRTSDGRLVLCSEWSLIAGYMIWFVIVAALVVTVFWRSACAG